MRQRPGNHNPVCGDETTVQLALDGDVIAGIAVHGHGCAIATASGSILAELLQGKTVGEAQELVRTFRGLLAGQEAVDESQLGDLMALAGVRQFPVRIKCAALPWDTLTRALLKADQCV